MKIRLWLQEMFLILHNSKYWRIDEGNFLSNIFELRGKEQPLRSKSLVQAFSSGWVLDLDPQQRCGRKQWRNYGFEPGGKLRWKEPTGHCRGPTTQHL